MEFSNQGPSNAQQSECIRTRPPGLGRGLMILWLGDCGRFKDFRAVTVEGLVEHLVSGVLQKKLDSLRLKNPGDCPGLKNPGDCPGTRGVAFGVKP